MSEETKEATPEVAKEETKQDDGHVKLAPEEASTLREKAARFEKFQERYFKDPNFKTVVEGAWEGKKFVEFQESLAKQQDAIDDPYAAIKRDVTEGRAEEKKLRQDLEETRQFIVNEKYQQAESATTGRYEDEFAAMAEEIGYDPGSPAYQILFDNVEKAGNNIARRQGYNDWKVNYKQGFMKQAFEEGISNHKRAGFDEAWKNRQQILKQEEQKRNAPKNPMDLFFEKNKDMMKTSEGRRQAVEDYFRNRFPDMDKMRF